MASKKTKTPEERLAGWMAGKARKTISYSELTERGWEGGQVAYIECYEMRYEKFDLGNGTFAVVEWDEFGNVTVA